MDRGPAACLSTLCVCNNPGLDRGFSWVRHLACARFSLLGWQASGGEQVGHNLSQVNQP